MKNIFFHLLDITGCENSFSVKVACVVDLKLFFYGLILLQFDSTN